MAEEGLRLEAKGLRKKARGQRSDMSMSMREAVGNGEGINRRGRVGTQRRGDL
jgi:hypothetical protein